MEFKNIRAMNTKIKLSLKFTMKFSGRRLPRRIDFRANNLTSYKIDDFAIREWNIRVKSIRHRKVVEIILIWLKSLNAQSCCW